MKYTYTVQQLATLTVGQNPRIPSRMALAGLMENIEAVGLKEPIVIWEPEKGRIEVIRGHRRREALMLLRSQNAKRFEELFGKGIPCLMVTGVTTDEVLDLKLDHVGVQDLSDPHELQRSANMLFAVGRTETEVAMQLSGLIDKISPMNSKAKVELDTLREKSKLAMARGNGAAVELAERDIKTFVGNYRRGFVQNLHNTFRCPDIVMAALYLKATGSKPEGVTDYLPKIGATEVTSLWKAHKADLELKKDGAPIYSKQRPGPAFRMRWDEYIAKEKEALENPKADEARPKAMSAKEMDQEVKDGIWKSALACAIVQRHMGAAKTDLTGLDNEAHFMDLIKAHDKALFAKVMEAGVAINARLVQQDNEAKAKETKPVESK